MEILWSSISLCAMNWRLNSIFQKDLKAWEEAQLIKPTGFTEKNIPLYSAHTIEEVEAIQKFLEIGYDVDDIRKIMKKVGLPQIVNKKNAKKSRAQFLTVGNLAEKVGVSTRTIKHWEDKGIIEPDTRSEGGFRLYSEVYIYLCKLILDLQHFGYSLEEIKTFSDYFRDFIDLQNNWTKKSPTTLEHKLATMLKEINMLFNKTSLLKQGIDRWEDLLKRKKKEITNLQIQNRKRTDPKNKARKG